MSMIYRPGECLAALACSLVLAGVFCVVEPVSGAGTGSAVIGVDVSHHQGKIDWQAAHGAGVGFAYVKATEGSDYTDPMFVENWTAIDRLPIHKGAYHYFRAGQEPEAQAANFIRAVREAPGFDLPPAVDVEELGSTDGPELMDELVTWLKTVEAELGVRPLIYTVTGFVHSRISNDVLRSYPLWFAKYDTNQLKLPNVLDGFQWHVWQYGQGEINGIAGLVDLNRFNCGLVSIAVCRDTSQ